MKLACVFLSVVLLAGFDLTEARPRKKKSPIFTKWSYHKKVIRWQRKERRLAGRKKQIKFYFKKNYRNTQMMQRSGRKRLYDHNIFLRALFRGNLKHRKYGNLQKQFTGAVFIDLGSAILMGKGAPTVRDLYDDKKVRSSLKAILATDINPKGKGKKPYIDIYRKKKKKLPFEVREIPMVLATSEQFKVLTSGLLDESTPVIFRSANSGPDLFYTTKQLKNHFKSMLSFFYGHDLMYFFNKFIFFKAAGKKRFHLVGEIDYSVGFAHNQFRDKWRYINWKRRKFGQSTRLNRKNLKFKK